MKGVSTGANPGGVKRISCDKSSLQHVVNAAVAALLVAACSTLLLGSAAVSPAALSRQNCYCSAALPPPQSAQFSCAALQLNPSQPHSNQLHTAQYSSAHQRTHPYGIPAGLATSQAGHIHKRLPASHDSVTHATREDAHSMLSSNNCNAVQPAVVCTSTSTAAWH